MLLNRNAVLNTSLRIRAFEQNLLQAYSLGLLRGTTHTCIGQELTPSIIGSLAQEGSFFVSNHRNHGHFIGTGGSPTELLMEIAGSSEGISSGFGGSQHLHSHNFLSHGILGGMVPFAVGKGVGRRLSNREEQPIVMFIGDGTFGEGVLYESLNLASIFQSCILFIVENNFVSQSTPTSTVIFGGILDRCKVFVSDCSTVSDKDSKRLIPMLDSYLRFEKNNSHPRILIIETERLGPHSKGQIRVDPWISESDPVFLFSELKSRSEFRVAAQEAYSEMSALFNSVLNTKVFGSEFSHETSLII